MVRRPHGVPVQYPALRESSFGTTPACRVPSGRPPRMLEPRSARKCGSLTHPSPPPVDAWQFDYHASTRQGSCWGVECVSWETRGGSVGESGSFPQPDPSGDHAERPPPRVIPSVRRGGGAAGTSGPSSDRRPSGDHGKDLLATHTLSRRGGVPFSSRRLRIRDRVGTQREFSLNRKLAWVPLAPCRAG